MIKTDSKLLSAAVITGIYLLTLLVVYVLFPLFSFSHPMIHILVADVAATVMVFVFSMAFNNSSVYDPYWSVVPPVIVICLVKMFPQGDQLRQLIIIILVMFWSIRLTANWFRGWQGLNHQDWRYTSMAEKAGKWYWPVSFLGIHLMPTIFVFLGCLPLYYSLSGTAPFGIFDGIAALFTVTAILTEWIADEQLIHFRKKTPTNFFISTGLWNYSRHPNYLGEICFWGGMFLFVLSADRLSGFKGYWTILGLVSMIILFKFISIPMMEKRNIIRKPGYFEYISRVPALFPRFHQDKRKN